MPLNWRDIPHDRPKPHFFEHQWVSSGGRLEVLQELLGHSQPSVTKLYCGRYDTETLRHEHEKHSPLADESLFEGA